MLKTYFFGYILIILTCVVIAYVFRDVDNYTDYHTTVLNQVANIIISKKNDIYNFKEFYSSGNIDFSQYSLVHHYLSLSDIECITSENETLSCSSMKINDISINKHLNYYKHNKYVCTNREYSENNESYNVRILNYDYVFNRTCLNMMLESIETLENDRYLLTFKNNPSVHIFMLTRPLYITTSMSYLYKVIYENNPIHYSASINNPRNYTSSATYFNVLVEKVKDPIIYDVSNLYEISNIQQFETESDLKCSEVPIVVPNTTFDSFSCAVTTYYLSIVDKTKNLLTDLTNAFTLYFKINVDSLETGHILFELRRSSIGTSNICKTFTVKLTKESSNYISIILNEMNSMTFSFELNKITNIYDIFIMYSLDMIHVYTFYEYDDGIKHIDHYQYDTNVMSSWSHSDIDKAVSLYKCRTPILDNKDITYCVPFMYDIAIKMKLA